MAISAIGAMNNRFIGLSTDIKPTTVDTGATFLEYDSGLLYIFDGSTWNVKGGEGVMNSYTTIDLNQAAAAYTLFTLADYAVEVLAVTAISPADLTGTAAGSLTAVSIQSTDTSPVEFISASAGAKANLSAGAHIQYFGNDVVAAGKTITLTIAGGATTASQIMPVYISYRPGVIS